MLYFYIASTKSVPSEQCWIEEIALQCKPSIKVTWLRDLEVLHKHISQKCVFICYEAVIFGKLCACLQYKRIKTTIHALSIYIQLSLHRYFVCNLVRKKQIDSHVHKAGVSFIVNKICLLRPSREAVNKTAAINAATLLYIFFVNGSNRVTGECL